jgi:hypothetical protein
MPNKLYIMRPTNEKSISLEEWVSAVRFVKGVRLAGGECEIRNKVTGKNATVFYGGSYAEVYFQDECVWRRAFSWSRRGRITFRPSLNFQNAMDPLRMAVLALTAILNAEIRSEAGDLYKL